MNEKTLEELYKPFEVKARQGVGGKQFKYVPSDDIVDRMNKVFKGNWSTEVISEKIIDDQILMQVRVLVKDPKESGELYYHEGYASQMIARYSSGQNSGKVIDIGNSYKAAVSKAIKTACAKWGVGLYLEKESINAADTGFNTSSTSFTPPAGMPSNSRPVPPVQNNPTQIPQNNPVNVPPMGQSVGNVPQNVSGPVASPVNANPVPPPQNNQVPQVKNSAGPPTQNIPPSSNNPFGGPPPQNNPTPVNDNQGFAPMDNSGEMLTDVQKVAIETIMSVHNMDFQQLLQVALDRKDNLPESLENTAYSDAVKLIQYGNNLRPV